MPCIMLNGFTAQASAHPAAVAVVDGEHNFSYGDLHRDTDRLAHRLREAGVGKDVLVGIYIERSYATVVALLSVIKAGGAYLPLDPAYPIHRLQTMVSDSRLQVLLTSAGEDSKALDFTGETIEVETSETSSAPFPLAEREPDDLVYVIYTSGSTGQPKGVAMGQKPLEHLLRWQLEASSAGGPGTATLQFAPLGFDVAFQEIFSTLCSGGTLILLADGRRADGDSLLEVIEAQHVNRLFLPFVALQLIADTAVRHNRFPKCLREIITAGEALQVNSTIRRFFSELPDCRLQNQYGPSETHVVTAHTLSGTAEQWPVLPPIGKALPHVSARLVDEQLNDVEQGAEGEILLGGECLARGYLGKPELTSERFISLENQRYYRTGDLGRLDSQGELEFLGRRDDQVKLRGYRVELGEIEVALSDHPAIDQAVVALRPDNGGNKRLIAYYKGVNPGAADADLTASELRRFLAASLPDYMLPARFVRMDALPRTPSGKLDRRQLPDPSRDRPRLSYEYRQPATETETMLALLWEAVLEVTPVGRSDNFFDLGGNSLLALRFVELLKQDHQVILSPIQLFERPTLAAIASWLDASSDSGGEIDQDSQEAQSPRPKTENHERHRGEAIAIIGMAARFPGAESVSDYWKNLLDGRESIRFFNKEEVEAERPGGWREDPRFVAAKGLIERPARFDAAFFGISPREAEIIDPQQRVFLELAWTALEDSAYSPRAITSRVGVFAGTANNSYYPNNIARRLDLIEKLGAFPIMTGNEKDYVASRVAHKLNLRGPAISVHTACSTSLVAVHQAVQSLRAGDCEVAIAGGASVSAPQCEGYLHQEGGMLSADGHCRPFDASASGTVFSDGAGAVVLKPLSSALADGDHIYAVIEGTAINNDGADKASFSAPNPVGQKQVILQAQRDAGVRAESIGYVEAHGTATPLGDPIEIKALNDAFRANGGAAECRVGSVKGNFGHLTGAAGIAGLIKAALIVRHGEVPPTLHQQSPNPAIDWQNIPFRVNAGRERWPQSEGRRAGVSSFGVGGTNAHVIVAQAPESPASEPSRPWQLLVLSHRSEAGLRHYEEAMSVALRQPLALADAAYSLNTSRLACRYGSVVVANTGDLACAAFQERRAPFYRRGVRRNDRCDLAFLFPGQGAQTLGMGQALYESEAVFQKSVDRSADILKPLLGEDIRRVIYPRLFDVEAQAEKLGQTLYTQLALFTVEYALAELWLHWGAKPAAMFGHSIGEWVAAAVAESLSLEEALTAVYHRARLMQAQPEGAMLSLLADVDELQANLPSDLDIAAINSQQAPVIAGPIESVKRFADTCGKQDIPCKLLNTSHAFHSRMMDGALEAFRRELGKLHFKAPKIPVVSCVSGDWISEQEACSPDYWARQIRSPVQCAKAFTTLASGVSGLALELGPGDTLTRLCARNLGNANAADAAKLEGVPTLSGDGNCDGDWIAALTAVGTTVTAGANFDWRKFYAFEQRRRLPLPGYPFEGEDYWVHPHMHPQQPSTATQAPTRKDSTMAVDSQKATDGRTSSSSQQLLDEVLDSIQDLSGIELDENASQRHLMELGLDSLLLTQLATALRRRFAVEISFRQLVEDLTSIDAITGFLWEQMGPQQRREYEAREDNGDAEQTVKEPLTAPIQLDTSKESGSLEQVISAQLQLMTQQLEMLRGTRTLRDVDYKAANGSTPTSNESEQKEAPQAPNEQSDQKATIGAKKTFGAQTRISTEKNAALPAAVQANLEKFIDHYVQRSPASREFTQRNRAHLADPRAVSGFTPLLKDMVYPIVVKASDGARLWDLDGNEYIDLVNGFGSNFLGHGPDRIKQALHRQIEAGWEIGPQTPLAAEVARLLCDLTGMERAALCNTGSEAVMGAVRLARTVTGRDKVVMFEGAYHGINDEVIVRAGRGRSLPAAAGIPVESVANVTVLEYGTDDALDYIRDHGDQLAAVLVEPVQSRRPDFQPGRFLTALRAATRESGTALIFDEVITGFRVRPGGAQEYFGIRADLATYGKIIGGGMPIGAIAGSREYMDALDGGYWRFGDDSVPEAGVTYFAGTFVRHPLAMAAARAALSFIREQGPQLQQSINDKTESLCNGINQYYRLLGFPFKLKNFGSLFKIACDESQPLTGVFFYKLRELGIHVWEGRPCFITLAHTDEDLEALEQAFKEAADFMLQNCFVLDTDAGSAQSLEKNGTCSASDTEEGESPKLDAAASSTPATDAESSPAQDYIIHSTEAQREIWLAARMDAGSNCAYNESLVLRLRGGLNRHALVAAIDRLRQRHGSLRATFSADGREMRVSDEGESDIELMDLSDFGAEAEQKCHELRQAAVSTPFDLQRGPLSRFQLLHLGENDHLLMITCHHIICDGWSIYLLGRELGALYAAELGSNADLPPARSFADYAAWERSSATTERHRASLDYWRNKLSESAPFLEWPLDKARPAVKTYEAQRIDYEVDTNIVCQARSLAASQRTTLTAVLLAAFAGYAHRLTGRDEILLGLPFAGQLAKQDLHLVGHCVNLLPLKIRVLRGEGFGALLARVKGQLLEAIEHQYLTFGTLLKSVSTRRDPSRPALLSTLFNVDVDSGEEWSYPGLEVEHSSNPRCFENFDLNLNFSVAGDRACAECTFNTDLWLPGTITRRLEELETFLSACVGDPHPALGELPLIPAAGFRELMTCSEGPARDLPVRSLVDLLDLRKHGSRPAVSCGRQSLDFQALDKRANQLANYLIAEGVEQNDRIGVFLSRSVQMLVSVLACWKAGAAYVPLEPGHPRERLMTIADSAGLSAVIAEEESSEVAMVLADRHIFFDRDAKAIARQSDRAPGLSIKGEDLAYLIFTSGSTGQPKGVEIPHRAVVNFLQAMVERPGLRAEDKVLAVTTLAFDISVLELILPLLVGAQVVIASREAGQDGTQLRRLLEQHDITVMQATPSTWRLLIAAGWQGSQSFKVICGGEPFPPDLARQLYALVGEVWNGYGPTEATVYATFYRVQEWDVQSAGPIPIGTPITNTQCYVLDEYGQHLPTGVPGELYIAGQGLARGYRQQPGLTAERFIDSPLAAGGKLYRTGDRARWRVDGLLECMGRLDDQVKLRGFRVELGEVEAKLSAHPDVLECAAAVKDYSAADRRLVAYVRLADASLLNSTEMRRFLRELLPEYMIPQLFVALDSLPLNANGKIDRSKLPDPLLQQAPVATQALENRCAVEEGLVRIWSELLQRQPESGEELFFDVGGHSLLALDLIARVDEQFGVRITPMDILLNSLSQLAAKVRAESSSEDSEEPALGLVQATTSGATRPKRKPGLLGRLLGR